ncbi:hypothetical protein SLE2022_305410 [Rubroshorea leprosula]
MEKEAAQEIQLQIIDQEDHAKTTNNPTDEKIEIPTGRRNRLLRIALYTVFVLAGQSVAILLGRLYFQEGGGSIWVATLVQVTGFPILIPYYFLNLSNTRILDKPIETEKSSLKWVIFVYVSLGLLVAGICFMYAVGIQKLPVSTVTLISASQLGFNAFFSYFLNSQKFTPFIINSLVLLTVSSVLLVFQPDSAKAAGISKEEYTVGFLCTMGGTAGTGLLLALQQVVFRKVIKGQTFKTIVDLSFYQAFFATVFATVGFFASGDWKGVKAEMEGYKLGKVSYVMTLVWTAVGWQMFDMGAIALIFEVSALFCNAISVVVFPMVPIIAIFVFHDKFDGIKVISMVLAIWGIVSYVYQHYLEDRKSKKEAEFASEVPEVTASNGRG